MISIPQIKAARGLLDWKQSDLAKVSGLSLRAIANIEINQGNPREFTLAAIKGAFERYGVVFHGLHGLEKKEHRFDVKSYLGKKGIFKIWEDIESTLVNGGEILLGNLDDRFWEKNYKIELQEITMRRQKRNITFRALLAENNKYFLIGSAKQYRAVDKSAFSQMPYYVYGNKVCFMTLNTDPFRFTLIESNPLAEMFRTQFEFHWDTGKEINL